jgi:hypothetical protein
MISRKDVRGIDKWKKLIEKEGITDLVVNDVKTGPGIVRELIDAKEELGIRNIIMLHAPVENRPGVCDRRYIQKQNRREFRRIKGLLMMEKLLEEHEAYPVSYSDKTPSDSELNEAACVLLRDEGSAELSGREITVNTGDVMRSGVMTDDVHITLALGGRIVFELTKNA